METRAALLRRCVMQAMADDYESLEYVLDWATKSICQSGVETSRSELLETLAQIISDGFGQAYILSPKEPYSTLVPFTLESSADLWFYLTAKGVAEFKVIQAISEQGNSGTVT